MHFNFFKFNMAENPEGEFKEGTIGMWPQPPFTALLAPAQLCTKVCVEAACLGRKLRTEPGHGENANRPCRHILGAPEMYPGAMYPGTEEGC